MPILFVGTGSLIWFDFFFLLEIEKRFVEWDPELLIEVDRFNSGYMDTTAACFSLVMGKNYTQRPSEVSQGKYGAVQYLVDTLLVLKCATVADVIIAPWNIVEDWIRFHSNYIATASTRITLFANQNWRCTESSLALNGQATPFTRNWSKWCRCPFKWSNPSFWSLSAFYSGWLAFPTDRFTANLKDSLSIRLFDCRSIHEDLYICIVP